MENYLKTLEKDIEFHTKRILSNEKKISELKKEIENNKVLTAYSEGKREAYIAVRDELVKMKKEEENGTK